jgi:hypothetical protein
LFGPIRGPVDLLSAATLACEPYWFGFDIARTVHLGESSRGPNLIGMPRSARLGLVPWGNS